MTYDQFHQQQQRGFRGLRFEDPLEARYQQHRAANMRLRARPVSVSALVLSLLYALLDWQLLPAELAGQTVLVRLLGTCPLILAVLLLSYSRITDIAFTRIYALAFLLGGLSVVLIILLARRLGYPLPYDGLHVILMFGYFVMGLPFRSAALAATGIVTAYMGMEFTMGTPEVPVVANSYFLLTTHIIGMVGAWLQEHASRHHYLDSTMLELARQEAHSANQQKSRFLAAASHDLRQPLNVINLLLDNLAKETAERQRQAILNRLNQSTAQLNRLLRTLLDISRIKEGLVEPEIRPLRVTNVLEQIRVSVEERAEADGVALAIDHPPPDLGVAADPTLLHRVLANLVYNALKHSGGTRISLSAAQSGARVCFKVRDNGSGIPEQVQSQLFEAFFRPDHGRSEDKGLGLGLAIVKELTELMGGRCGLESQINDGSVFWVELPSRPAPPDDRRESVREAPEPLVDDGILVVEDEAEALQWLHSMIQGWGYTVIACPDCDSARAAMEETGPFAMVLTDLNLPDGHGATLIRELRQQVPGLPAVIITGDTEDAKRFTTDEAVWLLHKPLAPPRLHATIRRIISGTWR